MKGIGDATVGDDIHKLNTYAFQYLKQWFYRQKGVQSLKNAKVKVLQYHTLGISTILYDPTPERKWLSKKIQSIGVSLKSNNLKIVPAARKDIQYDFAVSNSCEVLRETFGRLAELTIQNIESYYESINSLVLRKSQK